MRQDILSKSKKKITRLLKKYKKFLIIFIDDWRGIRFIFDTEDVRRCQNNCPNCDLYKLLKKEKTIFAQLYPATDEDKRLFGPQNFLNCKTFTQYIDCYVNFLIKKTRTKNEVYKELNLINQSAIVYAKKNTPPLLEKKFKKNIFAKTLKNSSGNKKRWITEFINTKL